ncbi:MAG: type 4a pilus biogenesis protein PilO [Candidatus Omnitrophica bacterium]|nr:type 4a pilus biogenesis protein PilO [Candidatus Omnitrophota bacterium]
MKIDIRNKITEFINSKSKKDIARAIIALFVVVGILYGYFFIEPAMSKLLKRLKEVQGVRVDLSQLEDALKRQDLLQTRMDDMNRKVSLYEKKLPRENEIPLLLEELSRMAKDTNVKIVGINPIRKMAAVQPDKTPKPYKAIPIGITAVCGYHELATFINRLEGADRFINIGNISVKTTAGGKQPPTVDIIVYTYILSISGG